MKKLLYLISIIKLTVLFSIVLIPPRISAQAHVYVSPHTSVLFGQGTVTVDFMISNVDSLQSCYISVLFNNSVIAFQSWVHSFSCPLNRIHKIKAKTNLQLKTDRALRCEFRNLSRVCFSELIVLVKLIN